MFTDIVGYTALAQSDERLALAALESSRNFLRPVFVRFNGREVKTIGDAFLVEFPSALDAVRCAIEIQVQTHERNESLPSETKVQFRIGVHVGDVIYDDGDILGDAVNVSSRVEPLASPGGVAISEQVFDHVRNKIDLRMEKLQEKTLKNVKMPVDVYRIVMPWDEHGAAGEGSLDRLRVAVLPLQNMSPDPNDEYFADGMTEELITTLAGVKELTVLARTSVMQYKRAPKKVSEIGRELSAGTVLEGSVRKAGNKVRITVQLIDARNDGHMWAQNYDKQLDDVFAIQTEIAEKVAEALRVRLLESEKDRLEHRQETSTGPYTLYLKGRHFWNERTKQGIEKAIEYFNAAVGEDPKFARGYAALGDCYAVMGHNGQMDSEEALRKAHECAEKALELDENLAEALVLMGSTTWYIEHNPMIAEKYYRKALELSPNYATGHQRYAQLLAPMGKIEEGVREIRKASELDPLSLVIRLNVGDGLYYLGMFDESIRHFSKIIEENPDFALTYLSLIQVLVRTSRYDEALAALQKYSALQPDEQSTLKMLRAYIYAPMGRLDDARRLMAEVEQMGGRLLRPYNMAGTYFMIGDIDRGFLWLEDAFRRRDGNLYSIKIDYEFDRGRSDPRYSSLLHRLGLEP